MIDSIEKYKIIREEFRKGDHIFSWIGPFEGHVLYESEDFDGYISDWKTEEPQDEMFRYSVVIRENIDDDSQYAIGQELFYFCDSSVEKLMNLVQEWYLKYLAGIKEN